MKLKKVSLCLFDGEGAGAEGNAADAGQQNGRASADASQGQAAADAQVDLDAEFDELVKNKFKDSGSAKQRACRKPSRNSLRSWRFSKSGTEATTALRF